MSIAARKAYVVTSQIAFMPHRHVRGMWQCVHPCILFVPCETCGAAAQVPCKGARGDEVTTTHHTRRSAYLAWKRKRPKNDGFEIVIRKQAMQA